MFRLPAAFCCWTFAAALLAAGEPAMAADENPLRREVAQLLSQLDSDRFEVRRNAARRLDEMVDRPELASLLAVEFRRVLVRSDVSFEVRWHVSRWSRRLPAPAAESVVEASPEELDRLVRQLDDDSYAVRLGAAERLDWLANNPKLIVPLMVRVKRRLADPAPSPDVRLQLDAAWQRVRGTWLMSDPAADELPAVSDRQIDQWLDDLTRSASSDDKAEAGRARIAARRELLDVLARDEYVARLTAAIRERLADSPTAAAAAELNELLDWTKPAMVAEYWQGRRHLVQQHLLIGVLTMSPGAARPTLFDRIDDRVAHYVTGNSLSPGDYPVGAAFPHPRQEGAFFHLMNLPTPRRRMAYAYYVRTDESQRLASLSRRTLDRLLAEKQPLSEPELLMLGQLDPVEVSRFSGKYFFLLADGRLPNSGLHRLGGRPSRFGMICVQLAVDGTKDALPGLTDALAKKVFLPPTSTAPYRLHWLAALSIASRDPWPEVDAWLAGRVGDSETLIENRSSGPELGATAAAVLLGRHGRAPEQFDLQPAADPFLTALHVEGYRFGGGRSQEKVRQWWEQEQLGKKTP